ncbi:TIGR03571 family LLM class oxidoreductase [Streptomyces sp. NTH33]|uniref:TIGR03571 family LLM class oxidoreductase n=1 Tax=Streptomyces sp. NTH33 TaxID=1735453 RepID=UPI0015E88AF6|nr:TIGR03571 family LLM class oxidoreductase [Streptomyces sp. NTH33]
MTAIQPPARPFTDHPGMRRAFPENRMTLGLIAPLESFTGDVPSLTDHLELVRQADRLGFSALWLRDVPFLVPRQGDAGQVLDPWAHLGQLAATTERLALGTASTVLPLRHPAHTAKAATTVDHLSGGRMLLGVATGDRPSEVPAFGLRREDLGDRFRESWEYVRAAGAGTPLPDARPDMELLPRPPYGRLPMLMTGHGRQPLEWIAEQADGWIHPGRMPAELHSAVTQWRALTEELCGGAAKPVAVGSYLVLHENPRTAPRKVAQGWSMGREPFLELLKEYERIGVSQLMLNLRFNERPAREVMHEVAEHLLPHFPPGETSAE